MSGAVAVEAVVETVLPNARFLCRADDGGAVTCHVAGDARMKVVRLLPGEAVLVERSPRDPSTGRIVGKKSPDARRSGS